MFQGIKEPLFPGVRGQGKVKGIAEGIGAAEFVQEAGTREKGTAVLV
ncbi:FOG: TPR repeat [Moorella thermoacetica Y72]|uniref:FOG: TPR repeat n=1 Tax=Moorella thermoacetica Y72 TaxID=1325331 RepID=A0A0S6UC88_NEOTH|nr:FOG: TPR repeat [Moorella thermoacetica Y72]